jgi:hypothetical protein
MPPPGSYGRVIPRLTHVRRLQASPNQSGGLVMAGRRCISRREGLKAAGAAGAAVALAGVTASARAAAQKPAVSAVGVAVGRMAKGHS